MAPMIIIDDSARMDSAKKSAKRRPTFSCGDMPPEAKGWKEKFGPDDLVRDEHWTELALDDWDGWDAVARPESPVCSTIPGVTRPKSLARAKALCITGIIRLKEQPAWRSLGLFEVVHHNGDSFALQAEAQRLAIRVSDLRRTRLRRARKQFARHDLDGWPILAQHITT